jgi:serine O-acetyltransferase
MARRPRPSMSALSFSAPAALPRVAPARPKPTCPRQSPVATATAGAEAGPTAAKTRYVLRMREVFRERCVGSDGDAFWDAMQAEARAAAAEEPLLASFMFATILNHRSLESALAYHLANKLASHAIPATQLMRLFTEAMSIESCKLKSCLQQDILAVMERDPACTRFIDCLCYYKGFHALQAHRIAHAFWKSGRVALSYHLQSQVSKELQVDIHPAAEIGPGAFFDHATGVVIGETVTIGRNVSMLHHVTLGGSGKKHGVRHPQIGDGVLIGAGAILLGNISVGNGAQIGACSLVLEDVPDHSTVVGVPAKVVFRGDASSLASKVVPALDMDHERCIQLPESHTNTTASSSSDATTRVPAPHGSRVNGVLSPTAKYHTSNDKTSSRDSPPSSLP